MIVGDGETISGVDAAMFTGVTLSGTVTASDNGGPIPDACVDVYTADTFDHVNRACTDEAGAYSVGGLDDVAEYKVQIGEWNSFTGTWLYDADSFDDADVITAPAEIDVQLGRGGHIQGTVTLPDGSPAGNVDIEIYDANDENRLVTSDNTDEDGMFWPEVVPPGQYKIAFESALGVQWATGQTTFAAADVIVVEAGQQTAINEQLLDMTVPGTISGTITAADTGEPIEGACALIEGGEISGSSCADAAGYYSVTAEPGLYSVSFSDPTGFHLSGYYDGDVVVESGADVTGIGGELLPAGIVEGFVFDNDTGEPIVNQCVNAFTPTGEHLLQDVTCSNDVGLWRLSVAESDVVLRAGDDIYTSEWYDDVQDIEDATAVPVTAGEISRVNDILLSTAPPGGAVIGTVTNDAGEPIEGACVQVDYVPNSRIGGCDFVDVTDADGTYVINDVPVGDQVFGAGKLFPHEYASVWNGGVPNRSAAVPVQIDSGSVTTLDFVLPPTATITGTVTMTEGYVSLDVFTVDGDRIGTGSDLEDGVPFTPSPDGGFQLAGLPTSAVRLQVTWYPTTQADEPIMWWHDLAETFDGATPIDVVSGEATKIAVRDSNDPVVIAPPPVQPIRER